MTTKNLLVELSVEELPPKALKILGEAFAGLLFDQLKSQGLTTTESVWTSFASPRRLAAHVSAVAAQAADKAVFQKVMPESVGMTSSGGSPALSKKLFALGLPRSEIEKIEAAFAETATNRLKIALDESPSAVIQRAKDGTAEEIIFKGLSTVIRSAMDGKAQAIFYDSKVTGATLVEGLQKALLEAIAKLPIPKVMTYQLADGWSDVKFVRPAHGLVALHGSEVVPVEALGLKAGNTTRGHRFEASVDPLVLKDADSYAETLLRDGAVIASFEERRAEIVHQLAQAAAKLGGGVKAIDDDALLDEVTALVERPNVLVCEFETEFLEVPQECLVLTMKANQKYFPLLDAAGKLTNKFLVVSNITPEDASAVIGGNERVIRPRLADAKFFFDQDRKKTLVSRTQYLDKVVYHNKLGTQLDRNLRVIPLANAIGFACEGELLATKASAAAGLAKSDLLTDMVGEFPELQGIMGRYYALNEGKPEDIAFAIEDHYKPRFAGDELPRNPVGVCVALADKVETLTGMFGIGQLPSGDKDPYALRRHALGVIRILIEGNLPVDLEVLIGAGFGSFDSEDLYYHPKLIDLFANQHLVNRKVSVFEGKVDERRQQLVQFVHDRLAGNLREQGYSAQEVDAVLALRPQRLGDVPKRLAAVRAFAALPEAPALAAANKRIGNILKKAQEVDPHVSELLLKEPAEIALYAAMKAVLPTAETQFDAGDYTASLQTLAALRAPVDAFFDGVMVNAEELDLRLNRQGLLKSLYKAMNRVADLSRLAS